MLARAKQVTCFLPQTWLRKFKGTALPKNRENKVLTFQAEAFHLAFNSHLTLWGAGGRVIVHVSLTTVTSARFQLHVVI